MEFAVNYSPILAQLVQEGQLKVDRYKCPGWPDLLATAQLTLPVYVHFPLDIGSGSGSPMDSETKQPADLDRIARLLEQTGTPLVNTHLILKGSDYPQIPQDSTDPRHLRQVVDTALRDLEPLIKRFGPERVLVENVINEYNWLKLVAIPEVMQAVLEESGCGFLFDLSHARLSARNLGLAERAYCSELPVEKIREVHVTGLQVLEGALLNRMVAIGDPYGFAKYMAGKRIDHLPMTDEDWPELHWALGEIQAGRWGQPWVVAYEYGGVGGFWEDVTTPEIYLNQLPKMGAMIHGAV